LGDNGIYYINKRGYDKRKRLGTVRGTHLSVCFITESHFKRECLAYFERIIKVHDNEKGFLQAIKDQMNDKLPRMVYADWLDEHGRHDEAKFWRNDQEATSEQMRVILRILK
jgi:uncharacterized protein (TIGR02996 family)